MTVIELCKKTLATLLLAFVVVAMVPACSSSDEQEDSVDCNDPANLDTAEECIQDLPI
jgi:uncharacterized lipoprotein